MATQSTLYSPFNGRLARSIGYEGEYGKQFSEKGLMIVFDVRRTHLNLVRPVLPSSNFLSSFLYFLSSCVYFFGAILASTARLETEPRAT